MKERKLGWAASALALAILAGCGSGGPGPEGNPIRPGPSSGQGEGFGTRQESPGRGFDSPDYQPENPGSGLDGPGGGSGGPGGPGGGGGPSRQEIIEICRNGCDRAAQACGIDAAECKADCAGVPNPATHPCGAEIRAVAECTSKGAIECHDEGYSVEGCDDEIMAFLACMGANEDENAPGGQLPDGQLPGGELPGEDD